MRLLPAILAAAALQLPASLALGAGGGLDVGTASCSSPQVEQYIMATLPTLYARGKTFGSDHTVEHIIFATNVRQSATLLACRLTVRMAYKGTDLPSHGIFDIERMANGKLRPTWILFSNWH